jgi:uncharacterized protein (TIGR01619 family)
MRRWMLVFLQLFGINMAHAQSEPAEDWEQYLTRMGDKPYAVRVDIGLHDHAPMADRSQRIRVLLHLKNPSRPEDGLPFPGEAPELARIENALKAAMKAQCGARYAGRMTGNGGLAMYFYTAGCPHLDAVVNETMRQFSSYRFEAMQTPEPSWKTYFDHLHPGAKGLRQMMNSRMFDEIEKRVENSGAARMIDHAAFFKSAEARKQFVEEIARHSFIVGEQEVEQDAEPFTFAVHFQRTDALQREAIDEVTMQLEDLAAKHGGRYDGWGALAGPKR